MKNIVVITTGGTISTKRGPQMGGAIPLLKGDDFLAMLPRGEFNVSFQDFMNLPSSHITPVMALDLAQRISGVLLGEEVDGVVVTHGTDTLEETAFLCDLVLDSPKPVIFTGSMRIATDVGYDGVSNLASAIRAAAAPQCRELGVLVAFNDGIHAASQVQKVDSQAVDAFQSPGAGPLGSLTGNQVRVTSRPAARQYIPCSRLAERIDLIVATQGADDRQLRAAIDGGAAGIVIAALGGGRVPPWWLPTIQEALSRRLPVVVTTRCLTGICHDDYGYVGEYHDLKRLGVIFAQGMSPAKARIKLMVALGAAQHPQELRGWFGG
ncbi:MAG TPA: asparaginase [Herpetosiphonaceae bacterium]